MPHPWHTLTPNMSSKHKKINVHGTEKGTSRYLGKKKYSEYGNFCICSSGTVFWPFYKMCWVQDTFLQDHFRGLLIPINWIVTVIGIEWLCYNPSETRTRIEPNSWKYFYLIEEINDYKIAKKSGHIWIKIIVMGWTVSSQKTYVETPTSSISQCDSLFRDLERSDKVKV